MTYRWKIKKNDPKLMQALAQEVGITPVFACILANRGLHEAQEIKGYLHPQMKDIHLPSLFRGMEVASARIARAIREQEMIVLYGDYDVDGVTGTSLLYRCLTLMKARVEYYIPHRRKEGYGLNCEAVQKLQERGARLLITIDCGIQGHEAIDLAVQLGMEVIITDHHEVGPDLPSALVVLNPKNSTNAYPYYGICGVGVAFKLAWAVFQEFSASGPKVAPQFREFLLDALALVALGTIADVAPLTGENRVMAKYGLRALETTVNPGLQALKGVANLADVHPLTTEHVGYRLGPMINAVGRLEDALICVELLVTEDRPRALALANQLGEENRRRKQLQQKIYEEAQEYIAQHDSLKHRVLVLDQEGWHPGVIGIVANRLVEQYGRPVLMIALENGFGKGSGRSIPGFHLFSALQACSAHLLEFGGHAMAAGFKIAGDCIARFREQLAEQAAQLLTEEETVPALTLDLEVSLSDLSLELVQEIEWMAPFGEQNPRPLLAASQVEVVHNPPPSCCGDKDRHLVFRVRQGAYTFRTIAFDLGKRYAELASTKTCSLAFVPKRNTWKGYDTLELEVKDFHLEP